MSRKYRSSPRINEPGTTAGLYVDANGVTRLRDLSGPIVTFDVTGAGTAYGQGTFVSAFNNAGTAAATYQDADGVHHGFERDASGAIATFDVPGVTKPMFPEYRRRHHREHCR